MGIVSAIDVASYQPRDLSGIIAQYRPAHVIVKHYLPFENIGQDHTRAQVRSARDNGCTVGAYIFLYRGAPMAECVNDAIRLAESVALVWPILWLDVEEYDGTDISPRELNEAVNHCDALGIPCGIYTSRYMWARIGNPTGFEDRPVWLAQYDGVPNLTSVVPPPKLPNVVAKQYRGDPLDLGVIAEEYTGVVAPPADQTAELLQAIAYLADDVAYKAAYSRLKSQRMAAYREAQRVKQQYGA